MRIFLSFIFCPQSFFSFLLKKNRQKKVLFNWSLIERTYFDIELRFEQNLFFYVILSFDVVC